MNYTFFCKLFFVSILNPLPPNYQKTIHPLDYLLKGTSWSILAIGLSIDMKIKFGFVILPSQGGCDPIEKMLGGRGEEIQRQGEPFLFIFCQPCQQGVVIKGYILASE